MHVKPIVLIFFSSFAGAPVSFGQSEAAPSASDRAIHKLSVPSVFGATLFAAEPVITHPVAIAWDAGRRAWVANTGGALFESKGATEASDSIVVLEDSDHDGRADEARVFADKLVITPGLSFSVFDSLFIFATSAFKRHERILTGEVKKSSRGRRTRKNVAEF